MRISERISWAVVSALLIGLPVSAKVKTISVWAWPTADNGLKQVIPDFEKKYPDIKIKLISMDYGQVHQKLLTTLAAGVGSPDVTMVEINHIASFRQQNGLLVDLSRAPYFANKMKDDFVSYKWSHASDRGRIMALPWDIGPVGLFYRRDMMDKAGLPSDPTVLDARIKTWDDYYQIVRKLTVDANGDRKIDQYGINDAGLVFSMQRKQNDCTIIDDNYTNRLLGNKQELFIKALRDAKRFRDGNLDQKVYYSSATKSATFMEACWASGWLLKNMKKTSGLWGVVSLPEKVGVNNGGSFLAIPGGAKNKAEAWKFIQFACANSTSQNKMLMSDGLFPAYKPAWKVDLYDQGVPFYAGQKANRLFTDIALKTPFVKVYAEDEKLEPLLSNEVNNVLTKGKDPGQAIKDAAQAISRYLTTMPKRRR